MFGDAVARSFRPTVLSELIVEDVDILLDLSVTGDRGCRFAIVGGDWVIIASSTKARMWYREYQDLITKSCD